jgi:FkbM family methyltransferase
MNKHQMINQVNNLVEKVTGLRFQPSSKSRLNSTRKTLLTRYHIKHVLDVGANKGQYAQEIRSLGFNGQIYSFEPTSYYEHLAKASEGDTNWKTYRFGFGTTSGKLEMYIASNDGESSSLLKPKNIMEQGFGISFEKTEEVEIKTLKEFLDLNVISNIYLKIDTQGNEMNVLLGLSDQINHVSVIEFESALISLYEGETGHYEIAQYLISHGFKVKQIVITHWNQNKETISLDSIFVRDEGL